MLSNVKTSFQIFQSVGPRNVVEGGPGLPEQHHRLLHLQSTGVERSGGGYLHLYCKKQLPGHCIVYFRFLIKPQELISA